MSEMNVRITDPRCGFEMVSKRDKEFADEKVLCKYTTWPSSISAAALFAHIEFTAAGSTDRNTEPKAWEQGKSGPVP